MKIKKIVLEKDSFGLYVLVDGICYAERNNSERGMFSQFFEKFSRELRGKVIQGKPFEFTAVL